MSEYEMISSRNLLLSLVVAGLATSAFASGPYESKIRDNVGVGLGTMIWGNVGDGVISQVSAATTNGSLGNQTFAVSSGTLGASKPKKIVKNELREYLNSNMDTVARAIASGSGESLEAILDIMAVPADSRTAVASRLQANFAVIYDSSSVTHDVVADRVMVVVEAA